MIGRRNSSAADLYFEFRFRILKIQPIIYLLIGLYLIMPLISPLLRAASRNELRTVLRIWGVTLFLPYPRLFAPQLGYEGNFGNMDILGETDIRHLPVSLHIRVHQFRSVRHRVCQSVPAHNRHDCRKLHLRCHTYRHIASHSPHPSLHRIKYR